MRRCFVAVLALAAVCRREPTPPPKPVFPIRVSWLGLGSLLSSGEIGRAAR